jgi:DnaK suppressor protein
MSEDNQKKIVTRYSDEDLAEFQITIAAKLEDAKKQLDDLNDQLQELNNSGDENRAGTFDDGASNWQREHLSKLASRQQKFVRDLEYAMVRIKNKTYGVCTATGTLISKERLKLVPHATKTVEGKDSTQGKDKKQEKPKFLKD